MHPAFCPFTALVSKKGVRKRNVCRLRACADSGSPSPSESFESDIRLLLCGELGGTARKILAQDLAKRAPEAVEDALRVRGLGGVADFATQVRNDIIPDVLKNGSAYVRTAQTSISRPSPLTDVRPPPFDAETFAQEVRNVFNTTPEGLYTPPYEVLASRPGYELRRYERMVVAQTPMRAEATTEVDNAGAMGSSFSTLAAYLFGENQGGNAMKMTTPVILNKSDDGNECMSFVIGEYDDVESVPKPSGKVVDNVQVEEMEGATYAVVEFSGFATVGEMRRRREKLLELLKKDRVELPSDAENEYKCFIYNGPTTLPFRRRQELMIEVLPVPETSDVVKIEESEDHME